MPSAARTAMRPAEPRQRGVESDGDQVIQLLLIDLIGAVKALDIHGKDKLDIGIEELPWAATGALISGGQGALKARARFGKATALTVSFGLDVLGAVPQATIAWRIGGSTILRQVDVTSGCSISGFAEEVTVSVADQTTFASPPAPVSYNVSITISPGTRPTTAVPPVFTGFNATSILAAGTKTVAVPLGASGVAVYGTMGTGGATIRVDHYSAGTIGGTATKIASFEVDSASVGFIPMMAGVEQIQVTNEGGSAATVSCFFSIDG
jgi:hypothetical protein